MTTPPEADEPLVKIHGLHFAYVHHRPVLTDLHLEVNRGVTVLVGLNGAGKSTLFQLLLGQLAPLAGTISVRGSSPTLTSTAAQSSPIGFLPQAFGFPPRVRTVDFVTYIGWLRGLPWGDSVQRSRRVLQRLGLRDQAATRLGELSGGMLRRVGIAQAIVGEPDLVLLDEPMAGLDPAQRIDIRDLLIEEAAHRNILMATHILDDVDRLADQVVVLHSGRAVFAGPPSVLAHQATHHRPGISDVESAFLELTTDRDGTVR